MTAQPPRDLDLRLQTLFVAEYNATYFDSLNQEMGGRLRAALACLILTTITVLGAVLLIYLCATSGNDPLKLGLGIPATILSICGGLAITTIVGIKMHIPVNREILRREKLNETLSHQYIVNTLRKL